MYSADGKTIGCLRCPEGYTTAEIGAASVEQCTVCLEGYMIDSDSGNCVPCPKGTYSDTENSASCTSCPEGETTPGNRTDDAELCFSKKNTIFFIILPATD